MEKADSISQPWAIEVKELRKSFGNKLALRGVDLVVEHGESVVIFGPNGAGKTTLIKVLATIMNPSSGSIMVDGLNFKKNAEEIRRRIGVVTHQTFLYSNLTAYENLEFYARMYDIPQRQERINEIASMIGMTSRLHDKVRTLSRGMQQRISIGRSLLHKPTIMLLDEPETGLDRQVISTVWEVLQREEHRKRTIILTTHNLERGLEVGERMMILAQGRIVYEHSTEALNVTDLKQTYEHTVGVSV